MACLYRIDFPSGKAYIGIAKGTAAQRFPKHSYCSRNGSQLPVHCAIRKYGVDSASITTLVVGSWEYVKELERKAIAAFGTKAPHGYNVTDGGDGFLGVRHSEATKQKLRERVYTPEIRANMSAAAMGVQKKPNTSGLLGVVWDKAIAKWRPRFVDGGKTLYLGVYSDWFEAVAARKSAEARFKR